MCRTILKVFLAKVIFVLLVVGCGNAYAAKTIKCKFDVQKRDIIAKQLESSIKKYERNHIILEIGDTNYLDYGFLFFVFWFRC